MTLGLTVAGQFAREKAGPYLAAQLLGALVGGFWLRFVLFGSAASGLGTPTVGAGFQMGQALVAEVIGTFLLVNTVLNSANNPKASQLAPLAIGLSLGVAILAFGPISGGSFNPARTLGPALLAGHGEVYIWLAVVAELGGGGLAALLYRYGLKA